MKVAILISKESYDLLARWASVGRTIDAAIDALNCESSDNWSIVDELYDLKPALSECADAAKQGRILAAIAKQ